LTGAEDEFITAYRAGTWTYGIILLCLLLLLLLPVVLPEEGKRTQTCTLDCYNM